MTTPAQLAADAKAYLDATFGVALPVEQAELVAFWKDNHWTPKNHAEKIGLAACAYAMTLLYATNAELISQLLKGKTKTRGHSDPARVFVETIYVPLRGMGSDQIQKLFSKYTVAVRHLSASKVLPSKVAELSSQPGEGVDSWSRRPPMQIKPPKLSAASNQKLSTPVQGVKFTMKVGATKRSWHIDPGSAEHVAKSLDKLQRMHPMITPTK